jgi:predicted ATPase
MDADPDAKSSSSMRFTRVVLRNWRNFADVKVTLTQRVFLVGPNASGKSNFLDAFRFLRDIASVGGGFQEAVRRRGGVSKLRFLGSRPQSHVVISVRLRDTEDQWEYTIEFGQDVGRRAVLDRERVLRADKVIVDRPNSADMKDPERLTQTYLEQVNANQGFRQVFEFLGAIRYFHIVPQLIKNAERFAGRKADPYGTDLIEQIAKTPVETRLLRLSQINSALRLAVPQFRELDVWSDEQGTPHLRGYSVQWPREAWQTEDQFSDGTLRFIGILWALLGATGPLLLEEPELSLHPEVVRFIPQMMAATQRAQPYQVFVSTHSRDLLEDTGIGMRETLLLVPGTAGTTVHRASGKREIRALLEGGASMADVAIPLTKPQEAHRLPSFADVPREATPEQLGRIAQLRGDFLEAERYYNQGLESYRCAGNKRGVAASLFNLSELALARGDVTQATAYCQEALEAGIKLPDPQLQAVGLQLLGFIALQQNRFADAERYYKDSLQVYEHLGDLSSAAKVLHNLAIIAQRLGELDRAEDLCRKGLCIHEELGDKRGVAESLQQLGVLAHAKGDLKKAKHLYQESAKIREST